MRSQNKADKLLGYSSNAEDRSNKSYEDSREGADFLSMGEPIKVGHHSEKRHRALIDRNHRRMENSIKEQDKAKEYERRAEYWESMKDKIDLSMPESIDYFHHKYEISKEYHEGLKSGKYPKRHSYSVTYANKDKKKMKENLEIAVKLWG